MNGRVVLSVVLSCACAAALNAYPVQAAAPVAPAAVAPEPVTDQVVVRYGPQIGSAERAAAEAASGRIDARDARGLGPGVRVLKVKDATSAVRSLTATPGVVSAELDVRRTPQATPNDPYFSYTVPVAYAGQVDRKYTSAEAAWDRSTGDATVRIAIVDSGIAPHPDLVPNLTSGYDVSGGSPTVDATAHGTQVAGMAAARGNDGYGVAGYCWNCRLMPVKVTRGTSGTAYDSDLASGIRWAADNGARIINVSYGGPTGSTTLASAVQYAQSRGSLVVAAAGNSGTNVPNYPASYDGVIGVGEALSSSRLELQLSSSFGSTVDIAAPTALTTGTKDANGAWRIQLVGGTSLASPAVAGTLGLMLATVPTASNASLLAALCGGATPMATAKPIACGRLDAAAAINLLAGGAPSTPPVEPAPTAAPTSPSPTPSSTPTSEPSPTPTPTPTATAGATWTFSSSLSTRNPSRIHTLTAATSTLLITANLARKCTSVMITASESTGRTSTLSLTNAKSAELWHSGGALTLRVSGCTGGYTLVVSNQP